MSTRTFAMIFGIVFILVGIAGFVPALVQPADGGAMMIGGHGMLLGLFPVNTLHNVVHLLFGLWGIAASRSAGGAVNYARGVAIIYAVLTVCRPDPGDPGRVRLCPALRQGRLAARALGAGRRLFRLGESQPGRALSLPARARRPAKRGGGASSEAQAPPPSAQAPPSRKEEPHDSRPFRLSCRLDRRAPRFPDHAWGNPGGRLRPGADRRSPARRGAARRRRPRPQPPANWRRDTAEELLRYVDAVGAEGLDPADYSPDALRAAIAGSDDAALTAVANRIFLKLAADLSGGSVRGTSRVDWHMPDAGLDAAGQQRLLDQVVRGGAVGATLDSLLPTHPQYAGLKRALANTAATDTARRDLIRTNMERWRWMPRSLGARHVLVNVPAFTAALVDGGRVVTRHRAVVGARSTPTPQLTATMTGMTMNPWWNVPQSIIRAGRPLRSRL